MKENMILYQKSEKCDTWVIRLIGFCKEMIRRVDALEKKCPALARGLDLQNLHLGALSITIISIEEKRLNNDNFTSEMLEIKAAHISELPGPTMDEFAAATDEFNTVMEGAHELEPEHRDIHSYDMTARLEPIATILTSRKLKPKR